MNQDKNNAAFAYSVSLLRLLLDMKLINGEEFENIVHISAAHYDIENIYV